MTSSPTSKRRQPVDPTQGQEEPRCEATACIYGVRCDKPAGHDGVVHFHAGPSETPKGIVRSVVFLTDARDVPPMTADLPSLTQRDDQLAEMLGRDLQTLARRIHDRLSPLRSIDPGVANVLIGLVARFPSLLSENAALRSEVDRLRATVERVEAAAAKHLAEWERDREKVRRCEDILERKRPEDGAILLAADLASALAAPVEGTEK